jgi:hypothetical protein
MPGASNQAPGVNVERRVTTLILSAAQNRNAADRFEKDSNHKCRKKEKCETESPVNSPFRQEVHSSPARTTLARSEADVNSYYRPQ